MDEKKKNRLEKIILETINSLIITGKFRNSYIDTSVFAVSVRISPDVGYADVYINQYQINKSDIKKVIKELDKCKGFIQREVGHILKTRLTPRLRFFEDISLDISYSINDNISN